MTETFQTLVLMMAVLAAVAFAARRLHVAPSILLVIAGVGLALVPGLPAVELAPEVVLLLILPPLIYSAGVSMSWREFRANLRPIGLLAFGAVVFTATAIATAMHYILGWSWPVGFVLGAIVAPPDIVAPLAIARRLGMPHRVLVILEGEGLANDATALILYRFAIVAVTTGAFSLPQAAGTFAMIVVGEIAFGIGVGWLSLRLRRWAHDPRVEITLSLLTPYLAYWVPEHVGGSGVLATVACGLYVSWRGPLLISAATRLQGIFFWDLFVYLIEGLVFLVTGLQARAIIEGAHYFSYKELAIATLLTAVIVIAARFIWVFPATYVPRWIPQIGRRDPAPRWQYPFIIGFTGVRGVVSLAAALAIPFATFNGPFPNRQLIQFITFGVILITLVGIGSILPHVVRWLGLANQARDENLKEHEAELRARRLTAELARKRLDEIANDRNLPGDHLDLIRARYDSRLALLPRSHHDGIELARMRADLRMALIQEERKLIHDLLRKGEINDESRRRIERDLDLEEAAFRTRTGGGESDESIPL
ncbi:MAG: Na+/H+ antiporter [Pseudolabrys sp.]|jgi:CPA1 family monovalent cation:H+ antiporter|nr:Na+/H+ antiporter [Pseudolabrys sp.]